MKLLLAQTSWGAQGYNSCSYPLGPNASGGFALSDITATFVNGRACPNGAPTTGANFTGGSVPSVFTDAGTGIQLIENVDYRPWEPVAPGVKPYRQHEFVGGVDYQLNRNWALEARYDRRRLDHAIEDASLADPQNFEMYTIVNPGEGVNKTIDGYANYLESLGSAYGIQDFSFSTARFGTCPTCPNNPKAIRNYDGFEVRVTKAASKGWAGMFSYTWSSLWGNYSRPDYHRSDRRRLDGPCFTGHDSLVRRAVLLFQFHWQVQLWTVADGSPEHPQGQCVLHVALEGHDHNSRPLPGCLPGQPSVNRRAKLASDTPARSKTHTSLVAASGPMSARIANTGAMSFGNPYDRRTPWFTQTDANFAHMFKVNKNNEHQTLSFQATVQNLFNQRAVVAYWESVGSYWNASGFYPVNSAVQGGTPQSVFGGAAFYQAAETGYNVQIFGDCGPVYHSLGLRTTESLAAFAGTASCRHIQLLTFSC